MGLHSNGFTSWVLYIRDLKFLTGFSKCDNVLVRSCFSLIRNNAHSILGNKLAYFRARFAININQCILDNNIKKIKLSTVISDGEQLIISNICINIGNIKSVLCARI